MSGEQDGLMAETIVDDKNHIQPPHHLLLHLTNEMTLSIGYSRLGRDTDYDMVTHPG